MPDPLNLPALRAVIGAMRIAAQAGETEEQVIVRPTDLTTLADGVAALLDACERLVQANERLVAENERLRKQIIQRGIELDNGVNSWTE